MCGDRLTLGVSPGSTDVDYATFDRDHAARFRTFDENLALGRTGEVLQRYADAGLDDAVVLIAPGGPDPGRVRALVR